MRPQRRRRPPQAPINQFVKAEKLTVISESGEKLGTFSKSDAIELAKDKGLDLLQITFDKEPCVAKIIAVSYTHLRSPRDRTRSRMPSSA